MANFKTQQLDARIDGKTSINVLPTTGHIIPFAGPSNKIPTGWVLCDGTNGTPDLRGKVPGGISNVAVGSNQVHSHSFSHTLGAFNTATAGSSGSISAGNTGNNSVPHSHNVSGSSGAINNIDSGIANRATGTQANVISRNHNHNWTLGTASVWQSGSNNANHSHGYNAYSVNATSSNAHSHTISSSPTVNSQTLTHDSLPSIFYVNFIMKV